ncbi:hypothetical protein IE53DRAFT_384473 [Violaceomyces palustris]|uniref:Uncharacterized protein n=1 Tax=Violaceomyces palustris TaxID=1673888 RepID=A0ACD0P4T7_9BASI|nr:hypothetical protein IE53DRAFT_384473 [Violaceomyces palustris]
MARPPSPGDDATPFLLRCYIKHAPFRPVTDFGLDFRPIEEECKLYVWRTTTLREITQMLHEAQPSFSGPRSLHAFRVIYYDRNHSGYAAREAGLGVTRVPLANLESLLEVSSDNRDKDGRDQAWSASFDKFKQEVDESSARTTLQQLNIQDGDILDCVVKAECSNHYSHLPRGGR